MTVAGFSVSALTATGDVKGIKLAWTVTDPWPSVMHYGLDAVEVWASSTNDRAAATKVGEARYDLLHAGLSRGDVRYYWIRGRDKIAPTNGGPNYTDWHPSGSTSGVVGTEVSGDVLIAETGYWKHPSGLIEQWGVTSVTGGSLTVTMPATFTNTLFNLTGTFLGNSAHPRTLALNYISNNQFLATIKDDAGVNQTEIIYWRALGY